MGWGSNFAQQCRTITSIHRDQNRDIHKKSLSHIPYLCQKLITTFIGLTVKNLGQVKLAVESNVWCFYVVNCVFFFFPDFSSCVVEWLVAYQINHIKTIHLWSILSLHSLFYPSFFLKDFKAISHIFYVLSCLIWYPGCVLYFLTCYQSLSHMTFINYQSQTFVISIIQIIITKSRLFLSPL